VAVAPVGEGAVAALDLARHDHYRMFLEASAAALLPLEQVLVASGVEQWLGDWRARLRSDHLRIDLALVGGVEQMLAVEPRTLDAAQLPGVLYVLEGSRLGAQSIIERVSGSTLATHYLTAGGPALWRSFLTRLEDEATPWDPVATVAAARWTFGILERAFARCAEVTE
jgi:heme oxygenase